MENISNWINEPITLAALLVGGVLVFLLIWAALKIARGTSEAASDPQLYGFLHRVRKGVSGVVKNERAATVLAGELSVYAYSIFGFSRKNEIPKGAKAYSSFREVGYATIFYVISFVGLVEIFAVHLLLVKYASNTVAWIVTILTIYTALMLVADVVMMHVRPTLLTKDTLYFAVGNRWESVIPFDQIAEVSEVGKRADLSEGLNCGVFPNKINTKIRLKKKWIFTTYFGIQKVDDTVLFYVDNGKEFIKELAEKLAEENEESEQLVANA
ncbi:MAG: hypothetical protein AAFP19_15725 [Bacteroidota bacterium]